MALVRLNWGREEQCPIDGLENNLSISSPLPLCPSHTDTHTHTDTLSYRQEDDSGGSGLVLFTDGEFDCMNDTAMSSWANPVNLAPVVW